MLRLSGSEDRCNGGVVTIDPENPTRNQEQDWMNTIRARCTDARIVRGGTNCRNKEGNGFCYFEYCPKAK